MEFMLQPHIRVSRPVTSNGINPVTDPEGRILVKTIHLPATAKRVLEEKNKKLPQHLKVKIEDIPGMVYQPAVDQEKEQLKAKVAEMSAVAAEVEALKKLVADLQSTKKGTNEK